MNLIRPSISIQSMRRKHKLKFLKMKIQALGAKNLIYPNNYRVEFPNKVRGLRAI
jgi:hypothetical protein